jgi:hypothetical protein
MSLVQLDAKLKTKSESTLQASTATVQAPSKSKDKFESLVTCAERCFLQQSKDLTQLSARELEVEAIIQTQKNAEKQLQAGQVLTAKLSARQEEAKEKLQLAKNMFRELTLSVASITKEAARSRSVRDSGEQIHSRLESTLNGYNALRTALMNAAALNARADPLLTPFAVTQSLFQTSQSIQRQLLLNEVLPVESIQSLQSLTFPVADQRSSARFPNALQLPFDDLIKSLTALSTSPESGVPHSTHSSLRLIELSLQPSVAELQSNLQELTQRLPSLIETGFSFKEGFLQELKDSTIKAQEFLASFAANQENCDIIQREAQEGEVQVMELRRSLEEQETEAAKEHQSRVAMEAELERIEAEIARRMTSAADRKSELAKLNEEVHQTNAALTAADLKQVQFTEEKNRLITRQENISVIRQSCQAAETSLQQVQGTLQQLEQQHASLLTAEGIRKSSLQVVDTLASFFKGILEKSLELNSALDDDDQEGKAQVTAKLSDAKQRLNATIRLLQQPAIETSKVHADSNQEVNICAALLSERQQKLLADYSARLEKEASLQVECVENETTAAVMKTERRMKEAKSRTEALLREETDDDAAALSKTQS